MADQRTVQENMERLSHLLKQHGQPVNEVLLIGDRTNLNAERGAEGYWGIPRQVLFEHGGRQVTHWAVVALSGPMCTSWCQTRATQLRALRQTLREVQANIGQPHHRTLAVVQKRANTQLKRSPVGKFMRAEAYADETGQLHLRWCLDRHSLWQAMQADGRYLLVTNDWSLSPQRMLALYRQKDGVEKRFKVSKSDLKVSPIYLHKDPRIQAMLLINMLALLVYSLLECQARQGGLQLTTRRIIQKLESLDVIETRSWDGSHLYWLVPVDAEQAALLQALAHLLAELQLPRWPHPLLPAGTEDIPSLALPHPTERGSAAQAWAAGKGERAQNQEPNQPRPKRQSQWPCGGPNSYSACVVWGHSRPIAT